MLTRLTVITSQYIQISDHSVLHLTLIQCDVSYISIKKKMGVINYLTDNVKKALRRE